MYVRVSMCMYVCVRVCMCVCLTVCVVMLCSATTAAIDAAMPEQIQQYEKEVRARNESMSSQVEVPHIHLS